MAQAYDAVIATIVVASDATSVTKAMVKSTTWREGTSGEWNSTSCTLEAGKTYQFRTPNSGSGFGTTAVLPNIKASVTVGWDTSGSTITTVGDYFLYSYAGSCSSLTSLSVPDISGLTTVGDYFMASYAGGCTSLTSLSVPDTSGLTTVGNYFMSYYAYDCTGLTSLSVPDTSGLTTVGSGFMYSYARSCSSLTSLSVPDTSRLTTVGDYFMDSYAHSCSSLTSLSVPDTSGLTTVGSSFMYSYARSCTGLTSLSVPDTSGLTTVGSSFMRYYAYGCTSLTSLSVPDTSGLTSVGDYFMSSYAGNCTSLTSLILKGDTGWFSGHNISWSVPSSRLNYLYAYCESAYWSNWKELTASGKTLYINYIQSSSYVKAFGDSGRTLYLKGYATSNSTRGLYLEGFAGDFYSRESASDLEGDDTVLTTAFSEQDYTDVESDDNVYVDLQGTAQYMKFLFKEFNENETNEQKFTITWRGKSSLAPSSAAVYLQVYNRTSGQWETLDSDSTTSANTKFTLTGTKSTNLSGYYDSNYVISVRVYQDVT